MEQMRKEKSHSRASTPLVPISSSPSTSKDRISLSVSVGGGMGGGDPSPSRTMSGHNSPSYKLNSLAASPSSPSKEKLSRTISGRDKLISSGLSSPSKEKLNAGGHPTPLVIIYSFLHPLFHYVGNGDLWLHFSKSKIVYLDTFFAEILHLVEYVEGG
eukprot:Phypoly_transcript_19076.p1 GENE.Phypoly_transcript_19076~~Phypoly_transcript_19076.p1  ORF type:complete len:158 (-),score=28.32 Phypoly_transcript_19076:84-557(-)